MKLYCVFMCVMCLVVVRAQSNNEKGSVRDKRTLHVLLQAFADSLGYDVQKRPPGSGLPKPMPAPRTPVAPPLPAAAPAAPVIPPKAPAPSAPRAPAPGAPMTPAPAAPMAPAPAAPKMPAASRPAAKPGAPPMAPVPSMAPAPPIEMQPPPKGQVVPAPAARPSPPPLLTETVRKMFNINFNWNRNLQTPVPPNMAAPAPGPTPKMPAPPAPRPKVPLPPPPPAKVPAPQPASAPAPQPAAAPAPQPAAAPAPQPAAAPAPTPVAAPAPKSPPSPIPSNSPTQAPGPKATMTPANQLVYYDYDDGQGPFLINLRNEYDGINYYDNNENVQEQQPQEEQPPEISNDPTNGVENQNENVQGQNEEQRENETGDENNGNERKQQVAEKQLEDYNASVQNFWQNSPWHQSNNERYNAESRNPEFYQSHSPHIENGHNFVITHPGGNSFSHMAHKTIRPVSNTPHPDYFYHRVPQLNAELRPTNGKQIQQNINGDFNYEGPSFDQYYYALENGQRSGKPANSKDILNNYDEKQFNQSPTENIQKENSLPAASLPIPAHNIYHQSPFVQWLSPFDQAGSENTPRKIKLSSEKIIGKKEENRNNGTPLFAFKYEPEHYESDFSSHTIPPPTQSDYSKYDPAPFKLEEELSDKAQIKEHQYGRKYTTIQADNVVHQTHG